MRQFPIHQGSAFCYQSQHQPCPVSCRWGLLAASCPVRPDAWMSASVMSGQWITWWESSSEVFFFFLLCCCCCWRGKDCSKRLVPRHKPAGPVGYVESSKSMSRSEREAGRRPFQLIWLFLNSLPIQWVVEATYFRWLCSSSALEFGGEGSWKHAWSISWVGNTWRMTENSFWDYWTEIAVLECHQSVPSLISPRLYLEGLRVFKNAREEIYYPTS